jgi:NAD(P)-dependent dehydrogenase (short-subunit alcohol dehydrogenase family)
MSAEQVLAGKVVLITGAGRGIGAACARYAAGLGATVVINDLDADAANVMTTQLADEGANAAAAAFDVADWTAVDSAVQSIVGRFGAIDGLVNNAATYKMAGMLESTPELWDEMIRPNVIGVAACGQRVARQMIKQGSGSIVNITSGAQCGLDAMSIYGATKAAVASMTYTWAIELAQAGVRVNAVSPRGATRMSEYGADFILRRTGTAIPPEPAASSNAPAVAYLLSDLSVGITGQVVRVDGTQISLMTHPAVSIPMAERRAWDVTSVHELFEQSLRQRMCPAGVAGLARAELVSPQQDGWAVPWDTPGPTP